MSAQSHLVFNPRGCGSLSQDRIAAFRALGKNEIIPTRHSAAVIHPQFIQRKMNTRGTKTSREPGTHLCEHQQNKSTGSPWLHSSCVYRTLRQLRSNFTEFVVFAICV